MIFRVYYQHRGTWHAQAVRTSSHDAALIEVRKHYAPAGSTGFTTRRPKDQIVKPGVGEIKIAPGVIMAQRATHAIPSRWAGVTVSTPSKAQGVAWVTVPLRLSHTLPGAEKFQADTFAERLWATVESLTRHGLTVNNIEGGRIIVTDDALHPMPPDRLWAAIAHAEEQSGVKSNPGRWNPAKRPPAAFNVGDRVQDHGAPKYGILPKTYTVKSRSYKTNASVWSNESRGFDRYSGWAYKIVPDGATYTITALEHYLTPLRSNPAPRGYLLHQQNPAKRARSVNKGGRKPFQVQTIILETATFTESRAKAWLKKNGHKYGSLDVTDRFIHARQHDPSDYQKGTLHTIALGKHLEAVVGIPKRGSDASDQRGYGTRGPRQGSMYASRAPSGPVAAYNADDVVY